MKMVDQDAEHLKILSILYYVWGGLTACLSCFGFLYAIIGVVAIAAGIQGQEGPPAVVGGMFMFIGAVFVVLGAAVGGLTIWAGRCLAQRQRYTLCFVMACLSCLSVPLGTALGVFTIIVLQRPTVKTMFGQSTSVPA
ncbi:MAG TPA: hypothetical protein VGF13_02975 [Verrucomicrobiae bacterium]|jgi:hypothetical protein